MTDHCEQQELTGKHPVSNGVKYFLDFDGVIFNVALLKKKMIDLGVDESKRSADVLTQLAHKDATFDLSQLVFTDARAFLEEHRDCCEIVSSFVSSNPNNNKQSEAVQQEYQEAKIVLSGVADIIGREHVHVVGTSKAQMLHTLASAIPQDLKNASCMFIDDRAVYVREALALGIPALLMLRETSPDTAHDNDDLKTITSFEGLIKQSSYAKIN